MKHLLIFLKVFLLSFPLFGQSKETNQFEKFYQETEILNFSPKAFKEPDKHLETFLDEENRSSANNKHQLEIEARIEREQPIGKEEIRLTEDVVEIDSGNLGNFFKNERNQGLAVLKKHHGVLSYRKENGAWGWYDYGDEGNDGKYVGDIVNMKPNGSGIFVYGKGKWEGDKYDGQWQNGEFHGKGIFIRKNGQRFFGEWKNSMLWNINGYDKFGRIIKKYKRGVNLKIGMGDEKKKKNVGQKRQIGILYREVPLSKWEQEGKKWMEEGDIKKHGIYEGEILNGVPDGEGTYSWFNVEKYVGEFRKGFFHGKGTFIYISGITAEGVFRKNKEWDTLRTGEKGEVTGKFVKGRFYKIKP